MLLVLLVLAGWGAGGDGHVTSLPGTNAIVHNAGTNKNHFSLIIYMIVSSYSYFSLTFSLYLVNYKKFCFSKKNALKNLLITL